MSQGSRERLHDLLAWRATQDLDGEEKRELEQLLEEHPEWDDDSFELAAASLETALSEEPQPLPESLRRRVAADARQHFAEARRTAEPIRLVQRPVREQEKKEVRQGSGQLAMWMGWLAAAALVVVALMGWLPRLLQSPVDPAQARQKMLAQDSDALLLEWQATQDRSAEGASGDVLWSAQQQSGFLRIRGLAANNPSQLQYQLWIFDRSRDERYPVDGGVFDIPSDADEVIVPIRAKLPVSDAHLFAVTVEQPGGVVVSSRDRIVLLANRGSG